MTKYNLFTEYFEFNTDASEEWTAHDIFKALQQGASWCGEPLLVAQADRPEDLAERFETEKRRCNTEKTHSAYADQTLYGEACYIVAAEYDEDDEYVQDCGWVDFHAEPWYKSGPEKF